MDIKDELGDNIPFFMMTTLEERHKRHEKDI